MELKTEKTGTTALVKMSGALTIEHAAELKTVISNTAADSDKVTADLDGVTDIDLSCIQLLCSASHWFEKTRKQLIRQGALTEVIAHALSEAGYAQETGCHGKPCNECFWKGRRDNGQDDSDGG